MASYAQMLSEVLAKAAMDEIDCSFHRHDFPQQHVIAERIADELGDFIKKYEINWQELKEVL